MTVMLVLIERVNSFVRVQPAAVGYNSFRVDLYVLTGLVLQDTIGLPTQTACVIALPVTIHAPSAPLGPTQQREEHAYLA